MKDLKTVAEEATITPDDIFDILLKENKPEFNIIKACEELSELQELLLKSVTKKPDKAPSRKQIIEELGDVVLRLNVVTEQLGITEEDIDERIAEKTEKLFKWYMEGKYKGGL